MPNPPPDNYITIPITSSFDPSKPIGYAVINKKDLAPLSIQHYVFAPAFIPEQIAQDGTVTKAQLLELSLIPGSSYINWYTYKKDQP